MTMRIASGRTSGRASGAFIAGLAILSLCASCAGPSSSGGAVQARRLPGPEHDLVFGRLAPTWDEGVPLGNGKLGALIWSREGVLRVSLDRADLWDLRPVTEFSGPEFSFKWVREHVLKNDYGPVHRMGDVPYDRDPAPTKIPAGALEFDVSKLGEVGSVRLSLDRAVCEVRWKSGARLETFVDASEEAGWLRFEGPGVEGLTPRLVPPDYAGKAGRGAGNDVVSGGSLARLGYPAPETSSAEGRAGFRQAGWGGMTYEVQAAWKAAVQTGDGRGKDGAPRSRSVVMAWSVSSHYPGTTGLLGADVPAGPPADASVQAALGRGYEKDLAAHTLWWKDYWARATIELPDTMLEKQWYAEMYKFGSAARRGAPPVTLQAVWTADNGSLPPWKGDIHNDLNTQLSYWPCYSGNRLDEGLSFLDWLWKIRPASEAYTKRYFGVDGLNVPGVCALDGAPLGGWIQYSLGPTVSAWLAQHFYLHWQYSRDEKFLAERAYPWIKETAVFLDKLAERTPEGKRKLPLSSSPEINDNSITAWFRETTNFDLALIRWLYGAAAETAGELGLAEDKARWKKILDEWPVLATDGEGGKLLVAPGMPLEASHRHFSHLMAIYPLGLLDIARGANDRRTITASLADLDRLGTSMWCGYSFAWLGALAARAGDGEKAAGALRTFAECFCLPNTFHANGDQCKAGHSTFTYRPFTLEGNFAFAAAIEEMLIQSHTGVVRIFPAVPSSWKEIAFDRLRTYGAFLVSARMSRGEVVMVRVESERGGRFRLENPFGTKTVFTAGGAPGKVLASGGTLEAELPPGGSITFAPERLKN